MRYEIDNNNAVKVFYPDSDVPSLFQPTWPNGESWADAAEASLWAELYIASVIDDNAPFVPMARGQEGLPKPTAEQKAARISAIEALANAKNPEEIAAAKIALTNL